MLNFSEIQNVFKPPPAPPDNFFRANPRRRAFIAPAEPGDERVIGLGANDCTERERRFSIMQTLGFGLIVVIERASPFDAAGQCWHLRTPLIIHRDVPLDCGDKFARELAECSSRTYLLPGLKRLSAFEFWHRHWREDFLEDGRLLINIDDLQRWARPRKAEAAQRFQANRLQLQGAADAL